MPVHGSQIIEISLWHTVTVLSIPLTRLWCLRTPKCQEAHAEAQQEDLVAKACRRVMLATAAMLIIFTAHLTMSWAIFSVMHQNIQEKFMGRMQEESNLPCFGNPLFLLSTNQILPLPYPTPFSSFLQLQIFTWPLGQSKTASNRGVSDSTETTVTPFTFKASKTFWSSEALGW